MDGGISVAENGDDADLEFQLPRTPDYERIKNARNERKRQLEKWQHYDRKMTRESEKLQRKGLSSPAERGFYRGKQGVKFPQSLIFLEAAARGDLDEVRKLLNDGVCPNVANENGLTALHQQMYRFTAEEIEEMKRLCTEEPSLCCIDNTQEMCLLLLRFGADPNARDTEQWTPLHAAATCNHTDLCKILIDHNADLLAMNADGNMPYECCMPGPTLNLIETAMDKRGITQEQLDDLHRLPECHMLNDMVTLCKSGGDLNALDDQGASWLHIAAACGYEDVTLFLIKNGAKVDLMDKDGWQAIHIAACWDHLEIIEILVNCGANIMAETASGETVFDICEDLEMHARLNEIKEEVERRKSRQSVLSHNDRPRESVKRRSGTNPRSASIRRTSMREKKMMSWKEAKQEAEMRTAPQLDISHSELISPGEDHPSKLTDTSQNNNPPSALTVRSPIMTKRSQSPTSPTGKPDVAVPVTIERQTNNTIWPPKPRTTHPVPSTSSHPRLINGSNSSSVPPTAARPTERMMTRPPNETSMKDGEPNIRGITEADRTTSQRHSPNAPSASREQNVIPIRVNQHPATIPEWHPIPSPAPKPRTAGKDRSSVKVGQAKTVERIAAQSSPLNRRSESSRRATSSMDRADSVDKPETVSPNLSAHNAYYSTPITNNHVVHAQQSRSDSVPRDTALSFARSRKQRRQARAIKVASRKPTMSLIEYESAPSMSGKCCAIM